MASRLASLVPRFVALPLAALLGTAAVTFAADTQLTPPTGPAQPSASEVPSVLVVPDVTRQAFVFAKGTLEDAGFAWKVVGPVQGYAANTVVGQSPAPGTRVLDTGTPVVRVTLSPNARYREVGSPENQSPYAATALELAGATAAPPASEPTTAPAQEPAAPPAAAAPAAKKPVVKKPVVEKPSKPSTAKRPPAFTVAGAPAEPLDEMPLVERARKLEQYVTSHPKPTNAVVSHFLYQHEWIVTGAEFGWWRGAEALQALIAADRTAQRVWGIGARSEAVARAALARVAAKSK